VSFALGAFLAGLVVGESDMSHQAAADALPLRDAFAVLFFVSVGMLLDPAYVLANPLPVLAVVVLIVGMKSITKFAIVLVAGYPTRVALTVGAGLAQIGEFSFIVGTVGRSLGLLPDDGFQLIVAGALLSITVNPLLLRAIEPIETRLRGMTAIARLTRWRAGQLGDLDVATQEGLRQHAIISGYGRVGRMIGPALERRGFRYVVITQQRREVDGLRARGIPAIFGDAANADVMEMAQIGHARLVIVATSDPNETRLIVERAQARHPGMDFIVRTHSDTEAAHLRAMGGKVQAVHGERELAVQMARYALRRFGVSATEAEAIAQGLRGRAAVTASGGPTGPVAGWWSRLRDRFRSAAG
jgi:CPA2 family monovalent cation:H+ antiporter-2